MGCALFHRFLYLVLLGTVRHAGKYLGSEIVFQFRLGPLHSARKNIRQNHLGALIRKRTGHAPGDSSAAAC